ncbi:MAG: CHAT domain-containing protein [Cyanobacteria bacterium Co-bin13]|nr:CHAT domain-containing protein [Cyanobacteria bacterium Co-bin13]
MTQEFHLSITPLGQDRYLVRTEEVAPGVPLAEEQVTWPVDDWLQQSAAQTHDPLLSLLQEGSHSPTAEAGTPTSPPTADPPPENLIAGSPLIALGQTLYSALFQGRIRDSWLAAQGVAQNRRQALRLRLGFKDSRLQRLPWELLYGDERPLATGTDIVFARYYAPSGLIDIAAMPTLPTEHQALQVLMVVSAPDDQERLALRQEVQKLKEELHPSTAAASSAANEALSGSRALDIQLTILEQPGRAELVQALERGQYQILHYAGHSDVSKTGGDLYLVSRQTGLTERLSGEDLAGLLVNNGIRVAVFNSCRGAYTAADDAESGWREQNLVQALVNRGVLGVIAMAERIPDDVAITFTQLFYRNLRQAYAIDLSLSRTRQGLISTYGSDQSYWMLPILYLHPDFDGYLFTCEGQSPALRSDRNPDGWPLIEPNPLDSWLTNGNGSSADLTDSQALLPGETSIDSLLAEIAPDPAELSLQEASSNVPGIADLLGTVEQGGPSYDEDAAIVTDLIQQLSTGTAPAEAPLEASQEENLLPDWKSTVSPLHGKLPERPKSTLPETAPSPLGANLQSPGATKTSSYAGETASTRTAPFKKWLPSRALLLWGGLGLTGAIAASLLALSLASRSSIRQGTLPPSIPEGGSPTAVTPNSGPLVTGAIQAVTTGNLESARQLLGRLLDQGDLQNVQAVLDLATPSQLESADLSFIRGRLGWQQIAQGGDVSIDDSRRAWQRAVEANPQFTEAWIALGFAYYSQNDVQAAIDAWNRAVNLDRRQVRDGEPGQAAIADPQVLQAQVGLAMAYDQLSQIAADPVEQSSLQSQALDHYEFLANANPALLSPNQLSNASWLWQTDLLADWKDTVENLAIATDNAFTEP